MNKELFRWARQARGSLIVTVGVGVLLALVLLAQMTLLSQVVSQVFVAHKRVAQVVPLLLWLLGSIIVHAGLVWVREITAQQSAVRVKSTLRARIFAHLFALGPAYSKGERTGELLATAGEGIERLDAYVSRYLPQVFLSVLVSLIIVIYILSLDWSSAILLLVTGPVIPLLMIMVGRYAEERTQHQWTALSRMSAHFLDVVQGLPTLKIFGRSEVERERITRVSNNFRDKTLQVLRIAFLSGMVLEFMTAVAIGLIAVTLGVRLLNANISFEHAFLVLLLAPEFYRPLRELGVQRHAGMEGQAAAQRIGELLARPVSTQPAPLASSALARQLSIEFSSVTYTYPQSEHPALQDVNLVLPAHTRTALVGRSGAGKSTLLNLLMRFSDPQSGSITVNGTPLAAIPVETWRASVAFVPQRPYLFYGSIAANIRLACPAASDEDVAYAADLAGATEFIERFPLGYATLLGEQGARLSAGQAQRIAIARALLKDAPLLLLDEPTSSLDPRSEALIRQALARLMGERTVLVIAHRLNTIAHVEQVAVLEDGVLVEVGQPSALLQRAGPYTRLMDAYRRKGEVPV